MNRLDELHLQINKTHQTKRNRYAYIDEASNINALVLRGKIVLLAEQGKNNRQIARVLGIARSTVKRWKSWGFIWVNRE